jgi:KUP system potassium uptake protein
MDTVSQPDPGDIVDSRKKTGGAALTLAAIGVVFGDIGTSPLYAFRECFSGQHGLPVTAPNVLGTASLIIWFLIIIVAVKYVVFVMRADNRGEGGILSLVALFHRIGPEKIRTMVLLPLFGIAGAALLFSDGVLTPAVSVLSAIEGVTVAAPVLHYLIVPLSLVVLTGLFLVQFRGTAKIGALFSPIVLVWFIAIALLGINAIAGSPGVLRAFNPWYALLLLKLLGVKSFVLLGAAFLAVTGAEVLYADMGHFGKSPIRKAWFVIVFPSLTLNYLGQAAKLLQAGRVPDNLFYSLSPDWFLIPLIIIATLATVIASQAVISGAFSLARQAVQLGFWPRIRVVHTSASNIGQVYLPFVNMMLYVVTFLLIAGFRESGNLASAYGIAVSATMLITSVLIILLARTLWNVTWFVIVPVGIIFLAIDCSLFIANLSKFAAGGWIVVVMAAAVGLLMSTWVAGRKLLRGSLLSDSVPFETFVGSLSSETGLLRPPKTAVFLSGNAQSVPRSLLHNFRHTGTLHATNVIVCVQTEEVPHVAHHEKVTTTDFGQGMFRVVLRYGYMESPDIPAEMARMPALVPALGNPRAISYYLGKESLIATKSKTMPFWRKQLFLAMARNALSASAFYNLPPNSVVELGVQIEF